MALAPILLGLLVAFSVFAIAWSTNAAYRSTFGALLGKIVDLTRDVNVLGYHPFRWLARDLDHLNHYILNQLGNAVVGSAHAWHAVVGQAAAFVHETMDVIADLAETTAHELAHLRRSVIPTVVGNLLGPLAAIVYALRKQIAALAVVVAHLPRTITHEVTHQLQPAAAKITNVTKVIVQSAAFTIPGAAGIPLPRAGRLEREVKGIDELLRDALRKVSTPVIAAIVATTVGALGLGHSRCSRVDRLNKSICGMDEGLLEALIADTLIIASTLSLVEFANYCQGFTGDVQEPLRLFLREVRDLAPVPAVSAGPALARYAAGTY